MSIRAAIDIGTNTVLLLIADVKDGSITPLLEMQAIPRLGRQVDESGNLGTGGIEKVIKVLLNYREAILSGFGDIPVIVTATSAVRDAANRNDFIGLVKKETGFPVRILTGPEEAEWTYFGAVVPLDLKPDQETLIVDIGGGSTELAAGTSGTLKRYVSIDMGSVRFTERYLKNDPPAPSEIDACRHSIRNKLGSDGFSILPGTKLAGVAGTVTSLAALCYDLSDIQEFQTSRFTISAMQIKDIITDIIPMNVCQILSLNPGILKGREDVILAGLLILEGVMDHYGFTDLLVSSGGIRHGALLKAFRDRTC
ncbi:MAG: Ppx/GppA family phosphatase [Cyclonatronaceae bacterium]